MIGLQKSQQRLLKRRAPRKRSTAVVSLTASLPESVWNIVKALKSGAKLVLLIGDLNEIFVQNYRYQTIGDWLTSALKELHKHELINNEPEFVEKLFGSAENLPLLIVNSDLLFRHDPERMAALVKSRIDNPNINNPLLLSFALLSSVPDELYSPTLDGVLVTLKRSAADNPAQLLSYYFERHKVAAAIDELAPALRGFSNRDIIYCLNRIRKAGEPISSPALLRQRLDLIRSRYHRLGAAYIPAEGLDDIAITSSFRGFLKELAANRAGAVQSLRRVAFYGYDAPLVMSAFAKELGLICIPAGNFVQDKISETKALLDSLEELVLWQPGCAVVFSPMELLVPTDSSLLLTSAHVQMIHRRIHSILDLMASRDNTAHVFMTSSKPAQLGIELNSKFDIRIPILPIALRQDIVEVLRILLMKQFAKVDHIPEPPGEVSMMTALHFNSVAREIKRRQDTAEQVDASIWNILPPVENLYEASLEIERWANTRIRARQ
jgi:hypothetical protein